MPPALINDDEDDYHGDTIIVKEESWSHPSTTNHNSNNNNNMSPSLSPLVHHLLSQIHPNQSHQTPHHHQPRHLSSPSPSPDSKPITMETRLFSMPELRPLPWRTGVSPGAETETGGESRRKQIRFGCLLATRGEVMSVPCNSCANGRGKFSVCVALEGFFKGACASCQLSGRPNRCSIKSSEGGRFYIRDSPPANATSPLEPDLPKPKRRRTGTVKEKENEKQKEKEKEKEKEREQVPEWESARPQWEQELGDSQARQQMNDLSQRPWAPVNPPLPLPPTIPQPNGSRVPSIPNPNAAWASVNQPSPAPDNSNGNGTGIGMGLGYEYPKREETVLDDRGTALIDTLPRQKQRQVYGLVSGLQGGIEHLQRELDSLKRALGIES